MRKGIFSITFTLFLLASLRSSASSTILFPTKFIIDKNGNIRFKYVGYSGSADKILDEVTDMIDMAQNPDAVAVVPNNKESKSK